MKIVIISPFSLLFFKLNKPGLLSLSSQIVLWRLPIIFTAFMLTRALKNNLSLRKCCNWSISLLHQYCKSLKQPLILLPSKLCSNQNYPVKQIFLGFITAAPWYCAVVAPNQRLLAKGLEWKRKRYKDLIL